MTWIQREKRRAFRELVFSNAHPPSLEPFRGFHVFWPLVYSPFYSLNKTWSDRGKGLVRAQCFPPIRILIVAATGWGLLYTPHNHNLLIFSYLSL